MRDNEFWSVIQLDLFLLKALDAHSASLAIPLRLIF